jgi:hypothetical protein
MTTIHHPDTESVTNPPRSAVTFTGPAAKNPFDGAVTPGRAKPKLTGKVALAAALIAASGAGAALGLIVFSYADSAPPARPAAVDTTIRPPAAIPGSAAPAAPNGSGAVTPNEVVSPPASAPGVSGVTSPTEAFSPPASSALPADSGAGPTEVVSPPGAAPGTIVIVGGGRGDGHQPPPPPTPQPPTTPPTPVHPVHPPLPTSGGVLLPPTSGTSGTPPTTPPSGGPGQPVSPGGNPPVHQS